MLIISLWLVNGLIFLNIHIILQLVLIIELFHTYQIYYLNYFHTEILEHSLVAAVTEVFIENVSIMPGMFDWMLVTIVTTTCSPQQIDYGTSLLAVGIHVIN